MGHVCPTVKGHRKYPEATTGLCIYKNIVATTAWMKSHHHSTHLTVTETVTLQTSSCVEGALGGGGRGHTDSCDMDGDVQVRKRQIDVKFCVKATGPQKSSKQNLQSTSIQGERNENVSTKTLLSVVVTNKNFSVIRTLRILSKVKKE